MNLPRGTLSDPKFQGVARPRRGWQGGNLWYFTIPTLLLNLAIVLVPALFTIVLAFFHWDGVGRATFAGLDNFSALASDPIFWRSLGNNIKWMLLFLTLPILIALLLASQLSVVRRGRTFFQITLFVPYILAAVVIARIWQGMIYSPATGLLGAINQWLPGANLQSPLAQVNTSLYGAALADMWHWVGFLAVVFFSALRQVDVSQIEAALVEGASSSQVFRHVLLPGIRPTIVLMLIMTVIWSFVAFEYVFILTQGGPAFSSELLSTLAYRQGFAEFNVGQAAAASLVIGVLGLLATVAYVSLQAKDGDL